LKRQIINQLAVTRNELYLTGEWRSALDALREVTMTPSNSLVSPSLFPLALALAHVIPYNNLCNSYSIK